MLDSYILWLFDTRVRPIFEAVFDRRLEGRSRSTRVQRPIHRPRMERFLPLGIDLSVALFAWSRIIHLCKLVNGLGLLDGPGLCSEGDKRHGNEEENQHYLEILHRPSFL